MRGNSCSDHMLLHKHLAFPKTHLKIFVLKHSLTATDNLKEQPKMMKAAESECLGQNWNVTEETPKSYLQEQSFQFRKTKYIISP